MNLKVHWKYPYLSLTAVSFLIAIYLSFNGDFKNFILNLGSLEYLGALIAGMFFVSSFTVAISIVIIGILAVDLNPLVLALIGGVGSVLGDLVILKIIKDHLTEELEILFGTSGTSYVRSVIKSKYVAWTLPIIGALIIASPLPDELGVSLLGLSKISETKFIVISYLSNVFGILAIASIVKIF